jgi:hypothetical protein
MAEKARCAAKWLREEAPMRREPFRSRIDALAFAVEWLVGDHEAVSAGCDALDAELRRLVAAYDAHERAKRLDPDIVHVRERDAWESAMRSARGRLTN